MRELTKADMTELEKLQDELWDAAERIERETGVRVPLGMDLRAINLRTMAIRPEPLTGHDMDQIVKKADGFFAACHKVVTRTGMLDPRDRGELFRRWWAEVDRRRAKRESHLDADVLDARAQDDDAFERAHAPGKV